MSLKSQKNSLDMAELCKRYGHVLPAGFPGRGFEEIAPGHSRKVYRPSPVRERLVLTPPMLQLGDELRPREEIAVQRDKRTLEQLATEVADAIRQFLCRACCGDQRAIERVVVTVLRAVEALEILTKFEPQKVRAVAENLPRWPVLLSLNPQEIEHVKKDLKSLAVGTKAITPTRPGQRRDPRNIWTRIADEAYATCRRCKRAVPDLERLCKGVKGERRTFEYWRTDVNFTDYHPPGAPPVRIWDWHKHCKPLSHPITDANFKDWWKVIKMSVLQYWINPKGNYQEVLNAIGQKNLKEWQRRELALARIKQAFRSLIDP
jgi:hypothetical protein